MFFGLLVVAGLADITDCRPKIDGGGETISMVGCGNLEIRNCVWERKLAIRFLSGTGKVTMIDSTVRGFDFHTATDCPIQIEAQGFEMRGCTISDMTAGIQRRDVLSYKCEGSGEALAPVFENCVFSGNTDAFFSMYIPNLPCKFKSCNWSSNTCDDLGVSGVLVTGYIECTGLELLGCNFDKNRAYYGGGAIHVSTNTLGETLIDGCSLTNNVCNYRGGAVDAAMSTTFRNCVFQNNTLTNNIFDPKTHLYGGDLYIEVGTNGKMTFLVDNCTFVAGDNVEIKSGGALYILHHASEKTLENKVVVTGSSFTNYYAVEQGGAIGSGIEKGQGGDGNGDLDLLHCVFRNCSAPKGGAVIFENGDELHDQNAVVVNCTFDYCKGTIGGALYTKAYTFDMTNSTVKNTCRLPGKDITSYCLYFACDENDARCAPKVTNCTIVGSRYTGIFVDIAPPLGITFELCHFEENSHVKQGGAIDTTGWTAETVAFMNCTFLNNGRPQEITREGGAIHINGSTNTVKKMTVLGCTFKGNKAYEDGGSVYIIDAEVLFDSCEFFNNDAQVTAAKGNHVYVVLTRNCVFHNCQFSDHDHANAGFEVAGESSDHVLTFSGPLTCFHGENSRHAPLLNLNTKGTVRFTGQACFQPTNKDEAVHIERGNLEGWNDGFLGCAECSALPKPTPAPTPEPSPGPTGGPTSGPTGGPTSGPTGGPTSGPTSGPVPPEPSESGSGGKLSSGAIAGIAVFAIIIVVVIVVIVLWVLKKKQIIDPASIFRRRKYYTRDVDLETQLTA